MTPKTALPLRAIPVSYTHLDVYKRQVWGVINLLEGYGSDNPAAKSQGIKQLMAGGGVVLIGLRCVYETGLCRC